MLNSGKRSLTCPTILSQFNCLTAMRHQNPPTQLSWQATILSKFNRLTIMRHQNHSRQLSQQLMLRCRIHQNWSINPSQLPKAWAWCAFDEHLQEDDPTVYSKITAVRFGVINEFTIPIKMITIVADEVFYTVKGVLIPPPNFLPKSFSTVEELTDVLFSFDLANICGGFKLVRKGVLTPSQKKNNSQAAW